MSTCHSSLKDSIDFSELLIAIACRVRELQAIEFLRPDSECTQAAWQTMVDARKILSRYRCESMDRGGL